MLSPAHRRGNTTSPPPCHHPCKVTAHAEQHDYFWDSTAVTGSEKKDGWSPLRQQLVLFLGGNDDFDFPLVGRGRPRRRFWGIRLCSTRVSVSVSVCVTVKTPSRRRFCDAQVHSTRWAVSWLSLLGVCCSLSLPYAVDGDGVDKAVRTGLESCGLT